MADEARTELTAAARSICDIVRSTLGPFGTNKLIIEQSGVVTTTPIGSLVLEHLDIDHPAVTFLEQTADDFRSQNGDGVSSVIALTGALLEEADDLMELGLHPTAIERGYRAALTQATDSLDAQAHPLDDYGTQAIARSALTSLRDPNIRDQVSKNIADTVDVLADEYDLDNFDKRTISVASRTGGPFSETELLRGVVLDKSRVVETMPRSAEGGIALLSSTVDIDTIGSAVDRTSHVDLRLDMDSFEDRTEIGEREREIFRESLQQAIDAGCRVIISERAINDRVKRELANNGILALQRVDEEDIRKLARLTGAQIVPKLDFINESTLGQGSARIERKAGDDMTIIESEAGEPLHTLFCRAPDPRSTESFEHTCENAFSAVLAAVRSDRVVPGGGAAEIRASHDVQEAARETDTREQLAEQAFGDALTTVPRYLARNAGMDATSALTRLHVAHNEGRYTTGVDAFSGALRDVTADDPILDPLETKRETWSVATDLCVKLLRIDQRLAANDLSKPEENEEEGGPGGAGPGGAVPGGAGPGGAGPGGAGPGGPGGLGM